MFRGHLSSAVLAILGGSMLTSVPVQSAEDAIGASAEPSSWTRVYRVDDDSGFQGFLTSTALKDGRFAAAGSVARRVKPRPHTDGWIAKISPGGETLWQKVVGGSQSEMLLASAQDKDGTILAAGWTRGDDVKETDGYAVLVNKEGTVLAQKAYGGKGRDQIAGAAAHPDGGFVLAGVHDWKSGVFGWTATGWVIRIDARGVIIWSKTFKESRFNRFADVAVLPDGGILLAGTTGIRNGWVVRLDAEGNEIWRNTLKRNDLQDLLHISALPGGGSAVVGRTEISPNFGFGVGFIVRLDEKGGLLWERSIGDSDNASAIGAIDVGADGTIAIAANFPVTTMINNIEIGEGRFWLYAANGQRLVEHLLQTKASLKSVIRSADGNFSIFGIVRDPESNYPPKLSGFGWSGSIPVAEPADKSN